MMACSIDAIVIEWSKLIYWIFMSELQKKKSNCNLMFLSSLNLCLNQFIKKNLIPSFKIVLITDEESVF